MTDFSQTKIRCSSLGSLFTDPKSKADKDAGELSKTAKTHLVEVYADTRWGRYEEITSKEIEKGNLCEADIIEILGFADNKPYKKNTERKTNEWITGEADIVDEIIIDSKASWNAVSYLKRIIETLDSDHWYQLQGYMMLWDKPAARVSYVLVNCPFSILQNEKRSLLYRMNVATEENAEYKLAAQILEKNRIFDDIPIEERIFNIDIPRDENIIKQIPAKVQKARDFLNYFQNKHLKTPTK